ncbi:hypothetical protein L7F22_002325 [Adiantum nelumboides]|nr:hypothetical protein [Adiantum nelumboides]
MTLLKFVDSEWGPVGAFNGFAVHGTSMSRDNKLISGDNEGVAARLMEDWYDNQPAEKDEWFIDSMMLMICFQTSLLNLTNEQAVVLLDSVVQVMVRDQKLFDAGFEAYSKGPLGLVLSQPFVNQIWGIPAPMYRVLFAWARALLVILTTALAMGEVSNVLVVALVKQRQSRTVLPKLRSKARTRLMKQQQEQPCRLVSAC